MPLSAHCSHGRAWHRGHAAQQSLNAELHLTAHDGMRDSRSSMGDAFAVVSAKAQRCAQQVKDAPEHG